MSWTNALKLTLDSSSVTAGLNQVIGLMGRASSAAGDVASAAGRAGGALTGAFKGLTDVLWKLPDQMRALSGILGTLSLPAKLAGSAETTAVAFRVLIGDAGKAAELLERIRVLAAATPFEFPELTDAARKLAAFGEGADTIPDTLRRIGDVAAGTQSSISDLAMIYGKARVAGTLYAEDINQLLERGIPVLDEFAKQTGKSAGEIKKLAAEGGVTFPMLQKAIEDLTGEGGKFSGMMEQISGTFEGKLSTLADSWKGLMGALGKGVNEGLKPVFDELTAQLDGQQGLAKSIGESIGKGIEVGLEIIQSGQIGEVLSTQLKAAALEFVAAILQGLEQAANFLGGDALDNLKMGLEEAGLAKFDWAGTKGAAPGAELGSSTVNRAAADARAEADAAVGGSVRAVEERRRARANEEANRRGRDAYYKSLEQQKPAAASSTADQFNALVDGGGGLYSTSAAVGVPVDGGGGAPAAPAPGMPAAGGPSVASGATAAAARAVSAAAPAVRDRGAPGKITGAYDPRSYTWQNGRRVYGEAPERADRMAGMANGGGQAAAAAQSADMAAKAAMMVVKLLPEIEKHTRRTANKS